MKKKQPRNPIKIAPWPTLGSRPIQVLKLYNISSKTVFTKILDALGCLLNTRLWFVWLQHFVFLSGICLPDWPWGEKKRRMPQPSCLRWVIFLTGHIHGWPCFPYASSSVICLFHPTPRQGRRIFIFVRLPMHEQPCTATLVQHRDPPTFASSF